MFGRGWVDPFKGIAFPHEIWTGTEVPPAGVVREMISSLAIAPIRRLGQSVHDLERASSAFAEWLADEAALLGDEFVNLETGASFDVAVFKSGPRYGAIRADFRLRTAGLAGATMYGSFVRRVAEDGYVLNIDGKE